MLELQDAKLGLFGKIVRMARLPQALGMLPRIRQFDLVFLLIDGVKWP
jgi:hypothetical protein